MTVAFLLRERRRAGAQALPAPWCPPAADREVELDGISDHALLEAVGGPGSRAALCELFHRHGAAVHRLVTLLAVDATDVDPLIEDVFVTLARRSGRLEDDVANVRLGLLAMAWRRTRPPADVASTDPVDPGRFPPALGGDEAALARLRCLPSGNRDALTLAVLAAATLTEVAVVLQADRRAVAVELRSGLCSASVARHSAGT